MRYTRHVVKRMAQRAISAESLKLVCELGREIKAKRGAVALYFGEKEFRLAVSRLKRKRLAQSERARRLALLEQTKGVHLIVEDDTPITAYRHNRPTRHKSYRPRNNSKFH